MPADLTIGIYGSPFGDHPPTDKDLLADLKAASFNTLVLWALHPHSPANFYFNDSPAAANGKALFDSDPTKGLNPQLPQLLKDLRTAGVVNEVLLSIGPFDNDFQQIYADWQTAKQNFSALINALSIDAIDFDYEGDYSDDDQKMIVDLTVDLASLGVAVTYCPYQNCDWWIGCLASVYEQTKTQPVKRFNLQCYDGGEGNDPTAWAAQIAASTQPLGIDDPRSFVHPGYWAKSVQPHKRTMCPSEIQTTLEGFRGKGLTGAWIWNLSAVFDPHSAGLCPGGEDVTLKGYSAAIANGLAATGD